VDCVDKGVSMDRIYVYYLVMLFGIVFNRIYVGDKVWWFKVVFLTFFSIAIYVLIFN
jgi:hypothetical protein